LPDACRPKGGRWFNHAQLHRNGAGP
jgi:hypothetical protein